MAFVSFQAMGDWTFWLTCLLTTVILMLPVVAWRFYRADVKPTLTDKVRLLQKHSKVKPKEEFRPFSGRRSRSVTFRKVSKFLMCSYYHNSLRKSLAGG